jgi:steroid 5-alpha reductase family enzyme
MEIVLCSLFALWCFMTLLFFLSTALKNNGVADVGYGLAFLVVVYATVVQVGFGLWQLPLLIPVTLWALRLASRIYLKNKNKPEDFRYKAWRDSWEKTFLPRSYLQIYMLQGSIVALIVSPLILALLFATSVSLELLVFLGGTLWIIGFLFESIADYQLDSFIKNPVNKGKIMTEGLWKYSRHPNYFGESLMWFGILAIATGFTPYALYGFISPLLITFLLLKVSGVPMLEKRWEGREDWEEYKKKTSVFVPLSPRA